MARRVLLNLLLSLAVSGAAWAQGVTAVHPVKPNGTALFPPAFASADNIVAQTATAMHGLLFAWDSGGSNWDRLLLTSGALHVSVQNASIPVTQSGAWTVTANAGTGTFAVSGTTFDGILKDGTGDTTQANVSGGRLHVDGSGVTQPVSGTVTANAGTNLNTSALLTTSAYDAAFGTAGTPDSQVLSVQGIASMTPLTVTATNLDVQIGGSDSLTIGTFPDNEPFNLAQIAGTAPAAHDAAMSGDSVPITSGCFSETPEDSDANTNGNRTSADADKGRVTCTRNGEVFVREGGIHKWTYHENSSSVLTDTTVHAACGAGLFHYVTAVTFSIGGATAASVMIEDSTTTAILGPYYLEAVNGRGLHVTFPGGKKQTTANTLISVTTTGAVAHGLDIQGFCAP